MSNVIDLAQERWVRGAAQRLRKLYGPDYDHLSDEELTQQSRLDDIDRHERGDGD